MGEVSKIMFWKPSQFWYVTFYKVWKFALTWFKPHCLDLKFLFCERKSPPNLTALYPNFLKLCTLRKGLELLNENGRTSKKIHQLYLKMRQRKNEKIVPVLTPTSQHVPHISTSKLIIFKNQQPHQIEVVGSYNIY